MEMINDLYKDGSLINKMYEGNMPINKAYKDGVVIYQGVNTPTPPQPTGYTAQYLTFEIIHGGWLRWKCDTNYPGKTISYSRNGGEWTNITATTGGTNVMFYNGDVIRFKGDNEYIGSRISWSIFDNSDITFNVYGNIMSIVDSQNFASITSTTQPYMFRNLFENCSGLLSAENLVLPQGALPEGCFHYMFYGCTSLSAITCLATDISATNCLTYWVRNVSSSGTFYKASGVTWPSGDDGIPDNWTIVDI